MMDVVEDFLKLVRGSSNLLSLVVFGSAATQGVDAAGDVDLCVVATDQAAAMAECRNVLEDRSEYLITYANKIVAFGSFQSTNLGKVDLFVIDDVNDVAAYLTRPGMTAEEVSERVLIDATGCTTQSLLGYLHGRTDAPEKSAVATHVDGFVEAFEHASYQHHRRDLYRFYFNMFIAHYHLVCLNYLKHGFHEQMYTPPGVYSKLPKNTAHMLARLEPSSKLPSSLKAQYLNALATTLSGVDGLPRESRVILSVLEQIVRRDGD